MKPYVAYYNALGAYIFLSEDKVYYFDMPEDTPLAMKVLFLLFLLLFTFATVNDCCLSDLNKELSSIVCNDTFDEEHDSNENECEHCLCSTFCSYSLLLVEAIIAVPLPSYKISVFQISPILGNEIFHPYLIFLPPIV